MSMCVVRITRGEKCILAMLKLALRMLCMLFILLPFDCVFKGFPMHLEARVVYSRPKQDKVGEEKK